MLAIVDYGAGNLTSVGRALSHLGSDFKITANPDELMQADGIIFPGVGHAGQAMRQLVSTGLDKTLALAVERQKPLLGICLGCHILLQSSEEGQTTTLGLLPGQCKRFRPDPGNGEPVNIPHMGWNSLRQCRPSPLLEGIDKDSEFYFVHSYYPCPADDLVIATTSHGTEFCSFYGRDGLWAVQFHPEKSGKAGLRLLANFQAWCKKAH